MRRSASMDIEFPVPQFALPGIDDGTQTSTPMEEILLNTELETLRPLGAVDKIKEWIKSNEFDRTGSLTVETGDSVAMSVRSNSTEIVNTDMIEQDTDIEEQPDLELLTSVYTEGQSELGDDYSEDKDLPLPVSEFCPQTIVEDNFDDSVTSSSPQIAFENPVEIPEIPAVENMFFGRTEHFNSSIHFTNPFAPKIEVDEVQLPQTPPSPPLPLPPRTPSPVPEQMLPPLPPKRKPSQELTFDTQITSREISPRALSPVTFTHKTIENVTKQRSSSVTDASGPVSQITITNTSEEISANLPSPYKKQGFFSRFFARRRSKPEPSPSKTTPCQSREPGICNFVLNDTDRGGSIRSMNSIQPNEGEDYASVTFGKPVGRSVSSVSGKCPIKRNGDIIHIPLKGCNSSGVAAINFDKVTSSKGLFDHRSVSAIQLSNVPITDGKLELVAIADREGMERLPQQADYTIYLDQTKDIGEAKHFALYTITGPSNENIADD
ncbi:embryonic polarity protein dorsal-like [Haematobia irritans]|uniref:embryonic polarity protein dorsal-like n=1 Tax=Haematobia irritans TaxID=7368 RepID=UPI003F4F494B